MTSIEWTVYPRFGRAVTARELDGLSPLPAEIEWARDRSRSAGDRADEETSGVAAQNDRGGHDRRARRS